MLCGARVCACGVRDAYRGSVFQRYEEAFPAHDVVVFHGAPHPAYLRDRAAANLFTDLVLQVGPPAAAEQQLH